jgi:aryl-alcohol dehydrogenase-like predicted oxidoreductase
MLDRGSEVDVLATCAALGLGVVVFSPLAQGMLTGKYRSVHDAPPGSRAADPEGRTFLERFLTAENLDRVDRLRPIARDAGLTLGQLAIAWVLRRPEIASAIVGASRLEQVEENVAAADVDLDRATLEAVELALR